MASTPEQERPSSLEDLVERAQSGDSAALERVVASIQGQVHSLALRFLWNPADAEDATQEILVRVVTRLSSFEGRSAFRTWVYRVATNTLLNLKATPFERKRVNFEEFGEDLARGLSETTRPASDGETATLAEEVKIGCTLAMLQCLERPQRAAFIVGEILEMDQREAADVLEISPAAYRKRLSRARERITTFMAGNCGLFNPGNACRCGKRIGAAINLDRVDPGRLLFATNAAHAKRFPRVLATIRGLEVTQRAAALYRSHPDPEVRAELAPRLRRMLAVQSESPPQPSD